jgi:hypothetical protein
VIRGLLGSSETQTALNALTRANFTELPLELPYCIRQLRGNRLSLLGAHYYSYQFFNAYIVLRNSGDLSKIQEQVPIGSPKQQVIGIYLAVLVRCNCRTLFGFVSPIFPQDFSELCAKLVIFGLF